MINCTEINSAKEAPPKQRIEFSLEGFCDFDSVREALSIPLNQDALREALARECEHISAHCHNKNWGIMADMLTKCAAAHRARKEGK